MKELAPFIAGFVVGEATFTGHGPRRFVFAVALGSDDDEMCQMLHAFFGVGSVQRSARRQAHFQDEVSFRVTGAEQLAAVVVPFMDTHLPRDSYKWHQYEVWREALAKHRLDRIRQPGGRTCEVDGCLTPARAQRLCRSHYYAEFGR